MKENKTGTNWENLFQRTRVGAKGMDLDFVNSILKEGTE